MFQMYFVFPNLSVNVGKINTDNVFCLHFCPSRLFHISILYSCYILFGFLEK